MKKIFYSFILFIPLSVNSQIQITSSDMPNVNDIFRVSIISGPDSINTDNTGAGSNWNYSFFSPQAQKADTFVPVISTPFGYQLYFNNPLPAPWGYPEHFSSYAVHVDPPPTFNSNFELDEVYYFFKKSSAQYSQTGFGAQLSGLPISQRFIPVDVIYEFPLNFGNTSSSTSSFKFLVPGYGYYARNTERNNTVDGWGTLTTPFGTFQTLRVKSELNITDTLFSDSLQQTYVIPRPTEFEYKWLANGKGIPVLQINATEYFGFPVISQIIYRDSLRCELYNLSSSVSTTNTTAEGASDGVAEANPSGGTSPYNYQWSDGGNTQTISNLSAGNYTVTVTDALGCIKVASGVVSEPPLNTVDILQEQEFFIYPNPNNGRFTVHSTKQGYSVIKIYNILGEIVYQSKLSVNTTDYSFDFPKGTYILKIISDESIYTKQLIIIE